MPLKAIIESLDDVEEIFRGLYKETTVKDKDGKPKTVLALDIEQPDSLPQIAALKNAFDRQKSENATIKARNAELTAQVEGLPEGFTVEEFERLKAFEAEINKDQDPEKQRAHQAEIQSVKNLHAQEIERLKTKIKTDVGAVEEKLAKANAKIKRLVVDEGLTKALVAVGVEPHFVKATKALLAPSVKVSDDEDNPTAVVTSDLGDIAIDEFVDAWSKSDEGKRFVKPPTGGGADGDRKPGGERGPNPFTKQDWNMTAQGRLMATDAAKAERLAKAAGHKSAATAKIEQAK